MLNLLHKTCWGDFTLGSPDWTMGTGIGYPNEARARMKGRYGTGEDPYPLTSLIKTIGGEFSDHQRNANHNLQSCVYSPVSTLFPVPGYDVGKIQKLELYDYLTLFKYPWTGRYDWMQIQYTCCTGSGHATFRVLWFVCFGN